MWQISLKACEGAPQAVRTYAITVAVGLIRDDKRERDKMRTRQLRLTLMLIGLLVTSGPGSAIADGIGGYVEYSGYSGSVSAGVSNDVSGERIGIGLAYDSNPDGDGIFNNRFDIGYVHTWASDTVNADSYRSVEVDYELNGLSLNNAFGFGVVRRENFRLWIGPAIGLGFDFVDFGEIGNAKVLSVGGGPQLGMNFKVTDRFLIALTAAYQYRYRYEFVSNPRVDDADGSNSYWLANVAFMYNSGS